MSASRHGRLLFPVARVGLAPLPHPTDVLRIPEVIAIGGLATPAPLAAQLAGLAAGGFAAVLLALLVAVIGEEELAATAALTSLRPQTHFESKPPRRRRELKQKNCGKKHHEGRRKKQFGAKIRKKKPRKKIQFQTGGFHAFSFRR